ERLIEADGDLRAVLGIEIRITEAREEQLIQRRRLESFRVGRTETRSRRGDLIARAAGRAHRAAEAVVVVDADAPRERQSSLVEEELVERVTGDVLRLAPESRRGVAEHRILRQRIDVARLQLVFDTGGALRDVLPPVERRIRVAGEGLRENV